MDLIGDPVTQRRQAVLQMSGYDLGPKGLDGIGGPGTFTETARQQFARRSGIDPSDNEKIDQALDAKLMNPAARDSFVRIVASTPRPSRADVAALQWVLHADGRDMRSSVDRVTGLMDGVKGPDTIAALKVSRRREPTMDEVQRFMTADNAAWYARVKAGNIAIGGTFEAAAAGQSASPGAQISRAADPKKDAALTI